MSGERVLRAPDSGSRSYTAHSSPLTAYPVALTPYAHYLCGLAIFLQLFMSYAIIRTGGKQFRVEPGTTLRIPSLPGDAGASIEFNDVIFGSDGTATKVGVPTLSGASVTGEIVKQGRGEKIIVFKFKRRKNYSRKQGHRQGFTEVKIKDIKLG